MKRLEKPPAHRLPASNTATLPVPDEALQELLRRIHNEYYYWDKVKHLSAPSGVSHLDIWRHVKFRRRSASQSLHFGAYSFHWTTNNRIEEWLHFLDLNTGAGALEVYGPSFKGGRHKYLISSAMEEAIASSQIEGAVTSRRVAKEMLRKKRKPVNRSERMILNNYITIQEIGRIKNEPLTLERLLHIHGLVTSGTMTNEAEEGVLRKDDEVKVYDSATGAVVHQPPPAAELDGILADLIRFFNEDDPAVFIHPIVKASIIHFMVGFIHPFADGNGRTARALFYWYLLKRGYWLAEYLSISRLILRSKARYALAFQYTEVDEHDLTYFILFNLRLMREAFDDLQEYVRRKGEERQRASLFLDLEGVNFRQAQVLKWFYNEPELLLTIREAQNRLGVSHQSARLQLADLARMGYLKETPLDGRTKGFQKAAGYDELVESVR